MTAVVIPLARTRPHAYAAFEPRELRRALAFVQPCMNRDTTRPHQNAIRFESVSADRVRLIATDGHRLAWFEACASVHNGDLATNVRASGIATLKRAMAKARKVTLYPANAQFYRDASPSQSYERSETFPPYAYVIPRDGVGYAFVDVTTDSLARALDAIEQGVTGPAPRLTRAQRARSLESVMHPSLRLTFTEASRTLTIAERSERQFAPDAHACADVRVTYARGIDATGLYDRRYILALVKALRTAKIEAVRITFGAELDPLLVQPWGVPKNEARYVCMPRHP